MDKSLDKVIKKHIVLTALTGLAVVLLMITITYGLYQTNHENTTDQEISLGDFDVDLTSSSGQITLNNLNPGVENSVTYTFTTSNSGDYSVSYSVYFTDNTTTFLADETNASTYSNYTQIASENYEFIEYKLDNNDYRPLSEVYDSGSGKFTILSGRLEPTDSFTHTVKFKVASNAPNELQGSILALNITMDAVASEEVGTDTILKLVAGSPNNTTDIITKASPSGSTCTNTLAYDNTVDNNLRFVGAEPCNYVSFNGESPYEYTGYEIVFNGTGSYEGYEGEMVGKPSFTTLQDCEDYWSTLSTAAQGMSECRQLTRIVGGFRIIGAINNVDNGTGKTETRLKIIRNDSLENSGFYSWDSSDSTINGGKGINEWNQADLMTELNTDYLSYAASGSTTWYNGLNNARTGVYNYSSGLKDSSQELIENAKWYLGPLGPDWGTLTNTATGKSSDLYIMERGNAAVGCNVSDGYCPRLLSWTGKIALMYVSDYGFSVGGDYRQTCLGLTLADYQSDICRHNNWLHFQSPSWTIDNYAYYSDSAWGIGFQGKLSRSNCYGAFTVRPAFYLKSDVKITGGNGSVENPYTLG